MVGRGATGPLEWAAPVLFFVANLIIAILAARTLGLLMHRKLVPAAAVVAGSARPASQAPAASRIAQAG